METTTILFSRMQPTPRIDFTSSSRGAHPPTAHRFPDFLTLMEPRVMLLAIFTAFGLIIAPAHLDQLLGSIAVFAIAAGAVAAGVLNVARRRHRCRNGSRGHATNSARQGLVGGSAGTWSMCLLPAF
jgi:heme O synthase-like polyprenyltransferase